MVWWLREDAEVYRRVKIGMPGAYVGAEGCSVGRLSSGTESCGREEEKGCLVGCGS